MFGTLPAYAFFCRHVRGIRFHNVITDVSGTDERPALVCHDVEEIDVAACTLNTTGTSIRYRNVNGGVIQGCRLRDAAAVFLDVTSGDVTDLFVSGNDFSKARRGVLGSAKRLYIEGNRS